MKLASLITYAANDRVVALLCLMAALMLFAVSDHHRTLVDDELRYADYAVSLSSGVYGLSLGVGDAEPGFANTPLYPLWLRLNTLMFSSLESSLVCIVNGTPRRDCPVHGTTCGPPAKACQPELIGLVFTQSLLFGLSLFLAWRLARQLLPDPFPVLVIPMGLLGLRFLTFHQQLMTENLVLPLYLWFCLSLLSLRGEVTMRRVVSIVAAATLLVLVRPEYQALLAVTLPVIGGIAYSQRKRVKQVASLVTIGVLISAVMLSPWLIRNLQTFGRVALADDSYSGIVLSERVAFNRMTTIEWFGGLVYWLPDFGDSLARDVLPPSSWERYVEFRPDSFYSVAASDVYDRAREQGGDDLTGYLLEHHVLADPWAHLATTPLLMWRGLFIGRYWGIIGAIGVVWMLVVSRNREPLYWLLGAAVMLLALRAGISASVARYNLPFFPLFLMGWCFIGYRLMARLNRRGLVDLQR